jgi:Leucine-rich repeat (LRR) protein
MCYQCKRPIEFGEFYFKNKDLSKERVIELWQCNSLEFYCCLCYDNLKRKNEAEYLRNQLSKKESDILKILEISFERELPLLPSISYNSVGFSIEDGTISGLSLFKMGLYEFPEALTHLKNLRTLNLAWNYLEYLPESLSSLKNLRELDLIGNHILKIPDIISELKRLEVLDLSFNNIQSIPNEIGTMKSLRLFKLIRNNITQIPQTVSRLESKGLKILL